MIDVLRFDGEQYPAFQSNGNAARFCMPFAKEVCKGDGFDIGCSKLEWAFPDAYPIDPAIDPKWNALYLPDRKVDYIFSSHCLEHVKDNYSVVLAYWAQHLRSGGVIFLYLPDFSQRYWRPWNNKKHVHVFTPEIMRECMHALGLFHKIFVSGVDAYNSFTVIAEKI